MSDIFGDWTRDVLSGTATADRIFGFSGRDRLSGLGGDDSLVGGRGDDSLYGGDGDDLLHGGTGSDLLRGGAGADTLVGGRGHDDLWGGSGADTFRFDDRNSGDFASGQADVIHDFGAHDILDLTRVDLLYGAVDAGPEPGRGSFSTWQVNGDTYVSWNTFGGLHDVVLKGYTGDVSSQIRWYQDDFSADRTTEGRVAAGESQAGVIEVSQDADWFKIDLTAGQVYTFDLKGDQGKGGLADPYLTLYDADDLAFGVASDDDGGGGLDAQIVFLAQKSGSYFLEASTFDGRVGTYHLSVAAKTYVDDFSGDTGTTGEVAAGETVQGEIGVPYDQDWFRISLTEGQTYTVDLHGASGGQGTLPDPYLTLLDADGNFVADADETPNSHDAELVYEATASGTFYLVAADYSDRTGTYALSVTSAATSDALIG